MEQDDDVAPPDAVVPGSDRPSRSAQRIVAAVAVAVVVLAGLAWWVLVVPYRVEVDGSPKIDCDGLDQPVAAMNGDDIYASSALPDLVTVRRACNDAEDDRRNLALLAGAGVAIAACAVSTVPSRRLTGDKLGPLR